MEETADDPEEAGMAMDWIMYACQQHNHKLKKKSHNYLIKSQDDLTCIEK
jgi:hypothetical protein